MPRIFDNIELDLLPALRETVELAGCVYFSRDTFDILSDNKISKELLRGERMLLLKRKEGS
jgi:hypothetical protein